MLDTPPFLDEPVSPQRASNVANIGSILLEQGYLTRENIEQILRLQKAQPVRFGVAAQHLGLLTADDVEQVLAQQFNSPKLPLGQGGSLPELVAAFDPHGAAADILRGIRSQLLVQGLADQRKTLAIVGVDDERGNSLLAANLAIMFSQLNKKIVLIDANLRSERQQVIFNVPRGYGLADVLAGRAGIDALIEMADLPGLSLLVAGTLAPNPAELLGRGVFRQLHVALLQRFDLVFIDSCGFGAQGEALALARQIDGAVISARMDQTRCHDVALTGARLRQAGIEVLGSVLLHHCAMTL